MASRVAGIKRWRIDLEPSAALKGRGQSSEYGGSAAAPAAGGACKELAMTSAALELQDQLEVEPQPGVIGHLPPERRLSDRWPLEGVATAFRLAGERFGDMHELRLIDYSPRGMGAVSHSVIEPGTIVSIGFQAPGYPAKRGEVVGCHPCGQGYRISIEFHAGLAA
jgi:hypothetical protein